MFYILVCQMETTCSMESKPRRLNIVAEASWIVESEFSRNARHILLDMSKLVSETASNTLLVVSDRIDKNEELLDRLNPLARQINGDFFVSFVPHPNQ